ncbi:uromodulin-like [Lingula anatina]|uniref:Uromodulin-like n=1 Tax=Lingula anatina TaxID=7574 RepID=A0A1S3K0E6_LINAN|nr:uromodulin-like [Lingula anatina]|eukprot:XP_013415746.1 uromodulin-like [Lingula anatina]
MTTQITSTMTTQAMPYTTTNTSGLVNSNVTDVNVTNANVTKEPFSNITWPADDPCSNYTVLNDSWRNVAQGKNYLSNFKCDGVTAGFVKDWYRFMGPAGTILATECQPVQHCGTYVPLYLNGTVPNVPGDVWNVTLCATSAYGCCAYAWAAVYTPPFVTVKNCGDYFVYELKPATGCYTAYCGSD